MDTFWVTLKLTFDLFVYGLVVGAGLPIIFALGVRLWAGSPAAADGPSTEPSALQKGLAFVCFALVAYAALLGILIIIGGGMGKVVDLPWPVLIPKP